MKTQGRFLELPSLYLTGTALHDLFFIFPLLAVLYTCSFPTRLFSLVYQHSLTKRHSDLNEETKAHPGNPGHEEKAHESTQQGLPCSVTAAFPSGNSDFSLGKILVYQHLLKISHFPRESQCNLLLLPLLSS